MGDAGDDVILGFDDESTQRTDLNCCKTWGEKKVIKTNSTDVISVNTMGFYPLNGKPVVYMPERGNSESFCIFLQKVREANGDKRIVMITDNCRIHKTEAVFACAETLNITLCFYHPILRNTIPLSLSGRR